jgi:hypothetical protein
VALAGASYYLLLSGSDINYAQTVRPPSFLAASATAFAAGDAVTGRASRRLPAA